MSALRFRNVDASPSDDVRTWPYEALVTAIERGLLPDWQPLFTEVRRCPWGPTARRIEHHLAHRDHDSVGRLFRLVLDDARARAERSERAEVARRVGDAIERCGLTAAELARRAGTSASRLSIYRNGSVVPSATTLLRIERVAEQAARDARDTRRPPPGR
jgi:hypothetical protein